MDYLLLFLLNKISIQQLGMIIFFYFSNKLAYFNEYFFSVEYLNNVNQLLDWIIIIIITYSMKITIFIPLFNDLKY